MVTKYGQNTIFPMRMRILNKQDYFGNNMMRCHLHQELLLSWWHQTSGHQLSQCCMHMGDIIYGIIGTCVSKNIKQTPAIINSLLTLWLLKLNHIHIFKYNWVKTWLLMPWFLLSSGHQQQCHWLYKINGSLSLLHRHYVDAILTQCI